MSNKKTTPDRLTAFSDAVFAVIITIMVLDLKPPAEATLKALLPLWPTALSYAVSYLFVAIIWVNHHHLVQIHSRDHTSGDLVELRPSLYGVPRASGYRLDGCNQAGGCPSLYLRRGVCPGGGSLHRL